jgi:hypothetical protein
VNLNIPSVYAKERVINAVTIGRIVGGGWRPAGVREGKETLAMYCAASASAYPCWSIRLCMYLCNHIILQGN